MNGVRERLREKFNRSSDPDKMELELNQDKGYGGYKKMMAKVKLEKEFVQVSSEDPSMGSQSRSQHSKHSLSEEGDVGPRKYQRTATNEVYCFAIMVIGFAMVSLGRVIVNSGTPKLAITCPLWVVGQHNADYLYVMYQKY